MQYCFAITFRRDNQRSYELRAESESDCKAWIQAVKQARYATWPFSTLSPPRRTHRVFISRRDNSFGVRSLLHSFNKLLAQKEELEQKHLHLLQIVESEKTAKWQYTRQCEELTDEIKQLRTEVGPVVLSSRVRRPGRRRRSPVGEGGPSVASLLALGFDGGACFVDLKASVTS